MTSSGTGHPVVASVDGSSALHAVRWAVREPARRHAPLRLVHVCVLMLVRHPSQVAPPPECHDAILERGRHWLNQAAEPARAAAPDVPLRMDLRDGSAADVLVRDSKTTQLIVLGSCGLGGFRGLLIGSVSVALAARAYCPVVVMRGPAGGGSPPETGRVVVGVDGSPLSDAVIEFALVAATQHRVPLIAVHSWMDVNISAGWAGVPDTIGWEFTRVGEARRLDEVLAPWCEKFPDVEVRKVVERDRPDQALLKAAAGATLVVVLTGLGLGSVSQSLLHHAECPVLARAVTR